MFLLQSKSGWDAFTTSINFTNLWRAGFAYKLRNFLRKLLLANCLSFTSQVRTDLMSTLHFQSHVSSLSQSWTNFLFTTAPCGKASFFFFFSLPLTASSFVEDVPEYTESQERSDIKQDATQRQGSPCKSEVSPCLHPSRAGSPPSSATLSQYFTGSAVGGLGRRPCPWRDPAGRAATFHTQEERYQPAFAFSFSLSPQGNPLQAGKGISASEKPWYQKTLPRLLLTQPTFWKM